MPSDTANILPATVWQKQCTSTPSKDAPAQITRHFRPFKLETLGLVQMQAMPSMEGTA